MSHVNCEIFARLGTFYLMARVRRSQDRIQCVKLYRFVSQMVGFMVIRVAPFFVRIVSTFGRFGVVFSWISCAACIIGGDYNDHIDS